MALPDTSNTCDRVKVQVLTSLAMAIVPKALNGSLVWALYKPSSCQQTKKWYQRILQNQIFSEIKRENNEIRYEINMQDVPSGKTMKIWPNTQK